MSEQAEATLAAVENALRVYVSGESEVADRMYAELTKPGTEALATRAEHVAVVIERERADEARTIAQVIRLVMNDPERERPRAEGGLPTDFLNDTDWAAAIAESRAGGES